MERITKQEIIERIVEHDTFETKKAAAEVLDILLNTIINEIAAGNEVYLGQSFGGFKPFTRSNGVKTPKFRASTAFKSNVKNA